MPPPIALAIGLTGLIVVIIVDAKRAVGVSIALIVPLAWTLIVGSRMVTLWLTPGAGFDSPDQYLEGSSLDRNIFAVLMLFGGLILANRTSQVRSVVSENRWLTALVVLGLISVVWSDFPAVSLRRWIKAVGNIIMVLVVLTEKDPSRATQTLVRRLALILLPLSIILIKFFPIWGRYYHRYSGEVFYTGVTTNKNALGVLCMVTGIYFLWEIRRWFHMGQESRTSAIYVTMDLLYLGMAIWLLLMARSATSLMTFLLGAALIVLARREKSFRLAATLLFVAAPIAMILLLLESASVIQAIVESTGHSDTFWGRVVLWSEFVSLSEANPLIGTGYDSYWLGDRLAALWSRYWWNPTEAHNGYVETYLELGAIGVLFLFGFLRSVHTRLRETSIIVSPFVAYRLAILTVGMIYNITESAFKGLHLMWFIILLVAVQTPALRSQTESRETYTHWTSEYV